MNLNSSLFAPDWIVVDPNPLLGFEKSGRVIATVARYSLTSLTLEDTVLPAWPWKIQTYQPDPGLICWRISGNWDKWTYPSTKNQKPWWHMSLQISLLRGRIQHIPSLPFWVWGSCAMLTLIEVLNLANVSIISMWKKLYVIYYLIFFTCEWHMMYELVCRKINNKGSQLQECIL